MEPIFVSKIFQAIGESSRPGIHLCREANVVTTYTSNFTIPWGHLCDDDQDSFEALVAMLHIARISLESLEPVARRKARDYLERHHKVGRQMIKIIGRAVEYATDTSKRARRTAEQI